MLILLRRVLLERRSQAIICLETVRRGAVRASCCHFTRELYKGVATKEDIDLTFRLGMAHPMGPITLADL